MKRIATALMFWSGVAAAQPSAGTSSSERPPVAQEAEGVWSETREEMAGTAPEPMGEVEGEPLRHTVTLDVAGAALGEGLNGQWMRSLTSRWSTVLGGNYSRTDSPSGSITKFGAEAGIDYFLVGRHNEGVRIGPRVVASLGVDTTGGAAGFGDVGLGAELGYNFISRQGLTAGAAAGWDLVLEGEVGGSGGADFGGHPYGKLNVGYSW